MIPALLLLKIEAGLHFIQAVILPNKTQQKTFLQSLIDIEVLQFDMKV